MFVHIFVFLVTNLAHHHHHFHHFFPRPEPFCTVNRFTRIATCTGIGPR